MDQDDEVEGASGWTRAEVVALVERAMIDPAAEHEAVRALVGVALHGDDAEFVERCCLLVGERAASGHQLLGLAALCVGHVARRFGRVSGAAVELVEGLAARAEVDPEDVDARALDGRDDVRWFPGRRRWAEFACDCGAVVRTGGDDGLKIISMDQGDEDDLYSAGTPAYRCAGCERLWVFWDGLASAPIVYAPDQRR